MNLLNKLRSLFRKDKLDAEMAEEMRHHVELQAEQNVAAGMNPDEARYAALRQFGNVASLQERARAGRGWVWLEQIWQDVVFARRSLSRAPGFSFTALFMLVLGIGVATAAFSLTAGTLFHAPPYPQPERLFQVGLKSSRSPVYFALSSIYPHTYQEQTRVFSAYAAANRDVANLVVDGQPNVVEVIGLAKDSLSLLGIKPVLGRGFLPEEYRSGAGTAVIVSDLFWREKLQGAGDILGRTLTIDQQPRVIVGVFAFEQAFPVGFAGEVYRPLALNADPAKPLEQSVSLIGRLTDGVTPEQATEALATVKFTGLPAWAGSFFSERQPVLRPLTMAYRPEIWRVVFAAGGFIYAIACLNVMNLMLVRLLGRRRELGIRLAVGGSRGRILRLMLFESLGLTLGAALMVALLVRWLFPPLMVLLVDSPGARYRDYWNWETLGCITGLGLVTAGLVVLVPAWRLFKADIGTSLKQSEPALGESRHTTWLGSALVMLQAALAIILLAGTGLMVRSFDRLHRVDYGFNPTGLVKVHLSFSRGHELQPEARLQLYERLQEKLSAIPGVRGVTYGQDSLLVGAYWSMAQITLPDGSNQPVAGNFVATDFQRTTGLNLKLGRWVSGLPRASEAVINETMARALFGDKDPIGGVFKIQVAPNAPANVFSIVGVVGDVRDAVRAPAGMRFYASLWGTSQPFTTFVLRLDQAPPPEFSGMVRRVIYETDPWVITRTVVSVNEAIDQAMSPERLTFTILKGLTAIALGIAVVGLFAVLSYMVGSRTREYGVRLALGARPADLHRLVMKRGVVTVAMGVGLGVLGALGLTRFIQSLLFETSPYDPVVYVAVAGALLLAAVFACWLPARRAAKVDPVIALRTE